LEYEKLGVLLRVLIPLGFEREDLGAQTPEFF